MVAKRIKLGERTELPLYALGGYVLSGPILLLGSTRELSSMLRGPVMFIAVIAFLVGAVIHILDRIDNRIGEHNAAMITKINDSVGNVYDAGVQSKDRHRNLVDPDAKLAVVRDLSPR